MTLWAPGPSIVATDSKPIVRPAEPFLSRGLQARVLNSRALRRVVARLLIGVLVLAQAALAAYDCPTTPVAAMDGRAAMGMSQGAAEAMLTMSTDSWRMDAEHPNLCGAHCQSGEQNVDTHPASTPPVTLLVGYFSLLPVVQRGGHTRPSGPENYPPPMVDPPHAILHCCYRN